jgi:thiosulfate/3-mercaptopyruvate sulfurtransferase
MDVLVDADWLARNAGSVVLADVRWYLDGRPGRAAFEAGHIPAARFVDLDDDLSGPGPATAGRHPLPEPDDFAGAMGRLGIADDAVVVAYDDSGGSTAGRLVWMLRTLGHEAALLDGGLAAWDGRLETGPGADPAPATFTAAPWPAASLIDADGVAATRGVVLDARSTDRFRGETEPVDARAGHIPGARNAPWRDLLDPASGSFRTPEELRSRFTALGVHDGVDVTVYCGSGVSACADLLALEHAGYRNARLFPASWSGWSADPARPVSTGDE